MRLALVTLLLAGCASSSSLPPASSAPPAPWSNAPLTNAPEVYRTEWRRAENRQTCALLAFADLGEGAGATPRRANFSGGWSVAYDTSGIRSAFGIAGSGGLASDASYEWPNRIRWSDGSEATYGPEGGTGPNELAYLRVTGEGCLYNVWSRLGRDHLEFLLGQLRRVEE